MRLVPKKLRDYIYQILQKRSMSVSQAGQDFWVIGECFNYKRQGMFVDIGAHDGIYLSNTYILEKRYGWHGVCVEPNPISYEKLVKNRRARNVNLAIADREGELLFHFDGVMGGFVGDRFENIDTKSAACGRVKTCTLDALLVAESVGSNIDYLSLDVEGAEDLVFSGFNLDNYCCKTMTIERPSAALRDKLIKYGYLLIRDIPGLDSFYIHETFRNEYVENMYKSWDRKSISVQWTRHKPRA